MSTQRAATLALFMLLGTRIAQAQAPTSKADSDTLTIDKGASPTPVRVRLVNVGAHVQIMGLMSQLVADTMYVTTPVRIVLPLQPFSISVSSADDATITMMSHVDAPTGAERFRSTIHAPLTLTRSVENGKLSVRAQGAGKSERVP